jgi:hypothetical protein
MKKQTAVEWLAEQVNSDCLNSVFIRPDLIKHAKAMEKEQIIDAFGVGCQVESTRLIGYHKMAEQYYNETFTETKND